MALGKNPQKAKYQKKNSKKKVVDAYAKKEWYDIKAPTYFKVTNPCKTMVNRSAGTKIASEYLKGRVFEINLADLKENEEQGFRKIKLRIDEVQGKNCLTNFHGMDFTTDKLRSLVRKWHTLIEASLDVRTTDGYVLRLFCIAQTARRNQQVKKTSYAQSAQIKRIRRKMFDVMTEKTATSELKDVVNNLVADVYGNEITKACNGIYPLQNVYIRKVKVLKTPKFDVTKLFEVHTGGYIGVDEDAGKVVA